MTLRSQPKNRVKMMSIKWTLSNRTSTQIRWIFERTGRINVKKTSFCKISIMYATVIIVN